MGVKLGDVLRDLRNRTFTGEGISKYYPKGSSAAYYHMLYSPARMEIRHKSPWGPSEERIVVQYEENDMEIKTIDFYLDGKHYKTVTATSIAARVDDGLALMIKYLFKDPRFALRCAENVRKLPIEESGECHAVTVWDDPEFRMVCDFFTDNACQLTKMRIHKFLLGKEIHPQNMNVIFSMPT